MKSFLILPAILIATALPVRADDATAPDETSDPVATVTESGDDPAATGESTADDPSGDDSIIADEGVGGDATDEGNLADDPAAVLVENPLDDGAPWIRDAGWPQVWTLDGSDEAWPIYTMTGSTGTGNDEIAVDDPPSADDTPGVDPTVDPVMYSSSGTGNNPQHSSSEERRAARRQAIREGVEVVFRYRDTNNDNALSPAEFAAMAHGHSAAFRRADRNGDGIVTLEEFSTKHHAGRSAPPRVNLLEFAACQATFATLDCQPKDGFLTFGEYTAAFRPSGPGVLERIFAETDTNGDGRVSLFEYCNRPVNPAGSD